MFATPCEPYVVDLPLTEEEAAMFRESASHVRADIGLLKAP
jgi:malate/lactate dehydrogenase